MLTFADNGDLFIGSRSGRVYRLTPPYAQSEVLITLADYPHSVALRGALYFSSDSGTDALFRLRRISAKVVK